MTTATNNCQRIEDAVILAADRDERLDSDHLPKGLLEIEGRSIIERTLEAFSLSGIKRVFLVVGYHADVISAETRRWQSEFKMDINIVLNSNWKRPNGVSLAVCSMALGGRPFLLSKSDRLFDWTIARDLVQHGAPCRGACLAMDTNLEYVSNASDTIKATIDPDGSQVTAIGFDLESFNAVDTRIMVCTSAIFEALAAAFSENKFRVTDGLAVLANRGKLQGMPVNDRYWLHINTPETLLKAKEDIGEKDALVGA